MLVSGMFGNSCNLYEFIKLLQVCHFLSVRHIYLGLKAINFNKISCNYFTPDIELLQFDKFTHGSFSPR